MNKSTTKTKIIGIDARLYGPTGLGLGRYIEEVINRLVKLDQINQYIIFLSSASFDDCQINQANVQKVIMPQPWYSLAEQLVWPFLIYRYRLNLLHVPHFNAPLFCPCRLIVTIHDLILTKFPSRRASRLPRLLYWLKNIAYRMVIWSATKRAAVILTVSEFTKRDIIDQLSVPADKIIVTYNGLTTITDNNDQSIEADRESLLRYNIKQPYLLYVGSAYPHKNLEWLVKLFREWSQQQSGYQLVLVGRHDYFYNRLIKSTKESLADSIIDSIVFPGFVPDNQLAGLYRCAAAYIFPSRYEGFGLPPLEAMSYGCPVISSDSSCLPEILGPAAEYFEDNCQESAITAMNRLLADPSRQADLVKTGFEQIKLYKWDDCAEQTLKCYRRILNKQNNAEN
jgi:glycosyltransferase involved in cell wall biosynthesis